MLLIMLFDAVEEIFKKFLWLRLTHTCFVQRTKRKYLHVCLCQAHVKKSW